MNAPTASSPIRLRWFGQVPYQEALDLMRAWTAARHQARKAATRPPPAVAGAAAAPPHDPEVGSSAAGANAGHAPPPASCSPQPPENEQAVAPSAFRAVANPAESENSAIPALSREWPDLTTAAEAGDEIWLLQHPPVFTLGMNSEPGHLLAPGDIPVVPTERGGQVTYHGPGQIMAYLMLDLRARKLGIRVLVERVEDALIACLAGYGITAIRQEGAPGIYVHPRKPVQHWPALPASFSLPGGNEGIFAPRKEGSSAAPDHGAETFASNEGNPETPPPRPACSSNRTRTRQRRARPLRSKRRHAHTALARKPCATSAPRQHTWPKSPPSA